ncbi:MAG: DUF4956 domain-containing protein [Bacteroidales bacterium 36-12]|nr:MAG: DUF4956 domain-containing protein [Bacteroidales bacterium 36-12]
MATDYGVVEGFTGPDFLGIPIFEAQSLLEMVIRFLFNILVCWFLVKYFYYKKSGRKDFYFTFVLFSVAVFLLIYLLDSVKLQVGMALGLFAIFGIIRYRTEQVSIREMTYLFIIIAISVINGLSKALSITELLVANLMFVGAIAAMESTRIFKQTATKIILYEKIHLITPDKEDLLMADLQKRTGLDIVKFEIGHIDFLKDVAFIKVYYNPTQKEPNTIDTITKLKNFPDA